VIQGDLRAADTFSAEVVELSRAHADHEGLAHALQFRGLAAIFASDLETADEVFAESLQAARLAGQRWLEAWAFEFQAAAALARGSYDAAVRLARQSVQLSRPEGDPECAAWALVTLATAQIEHGQADAAIAPLRDSLVAFRQLGVSWGLSLAVFACAQLAGLRADPTAATSFLGASEQLRTSSRAGMLPGLQRSFDHWRATCSAALGPDAYAAAWSAGAAETVEQTLSRAEQLLATPALAAP
jgi:ATP/maltotriose-dependent transcriptional regulator MalT